MAENEFEAVQQVRLLVLDVDGVMTDGSILLDDRGVETKRFHVRDGCGMRIWARAGYELAVITGRSGRALRHRLGELGVQHLVQGSVDKAAALAELLDQVGLDAEETAVLGDDLPDAPMLMGVGYPMAVVDACREVRDLARYITVRPGGHGAVREVIEHLLQSKGEWSDALAHFGFENHD